MSYLDDVVVIGGLSARLPECSNLMQVYHKLINHEDLVTGTSNFSDHVLVTQNGCHFCISFLDGNERWNVEGFDYMPARMGKIPNIDKFDASFFGILPHKVVTVDVRLSELTLKCSHRY